ncbi:MAG: FkbM family methyltransferase [Bacteroidota bacterium]|nr:FkbM family methyltransferase [Bacteroidota bacterium]MDP4217166.1 FkbM family methyltransferase [Bacteroidota bacterium]MDP4244433.1 FkbM family methyltransferase [Bacteroidota bacterium]MDP4255641.1 FkbM family methyltransferase [Bacteroidota bacterium]
MGFATRFANRFRNTKLHYIVCRFLEKFDMEGFTLSYAQCGEDLIIKTIFGKDKRDGFYVDIGCNNPIQKSNTFKLYLKGWRGICVDGNAGLVKRFRRIRRRDTCLCEIVSNDVRDVVFYQDDQNHELSSVDAAVGVGLKSAGAHVREVRMRSTTLERILEAHGGGLAIDLLCVDVEDHDLEVLKGNDFGKYRPRIICVESYGSLQELKSSELDIFLRDKGYELLVFSKPNIFYQDGRVG